jgi:hypothetical protein
MALTKTMIMKKGLLWVGFIIGGILNVSQVSGQIIISQYIEANSGSTPKGIELLNVSGSDITFTASNNLQIYQGTNGAACSALSGANITSGTLEANKVWVIGTSDLTSYASSNGTSLSGSTSYNFDFNGDDALQVRLSGTIVDVFGTCGSDPGTSWSGGGVSTANNNLEIKLNTCTGDTDGWTDPSERFDQIADGATMTGFGSIGYSCSSTPTPSITVSPTTLTDFTYTEGSGPSASQSYTLSGSNLNPADDDITVTGSTNYEVSTDNSSFSGSVSVAYTGGSLASTTIYVRLIAGLSAGNYNSETVSNAGGGATTKNVTCSGTVTSATITLVYSRGDGNWNATNLWSTTPSGAGTFVQDPNDPAISVVIQSGHNITMGALTRSVKDFTVQSGASIKANQTTNRYIQVYGSSVVLDGTIGGAGDGFSLDINGPTCTITGSGSVTLSRLKKDGGDTGVASTTDLTVDIDITLTYNVSASAALNNQDNPSNSIARNLNLTLNAGKTITLTGASDVCIDGVDGGNTAYQGGTFIINGTLNIQNGDLWITTDNPSGGNTTFEIGSTGKVYVGGKLYGNPTSQAGAAIAGLVIRSGGELQLRGSGIVVQDFSSTRNSLTFETNSTINYNAASSQTVEDFFDYQNLTSDGGGKKSLEGNTAVNGILNLTSGNIVLGTSTLTLAPSGSIGEISSFVETNGTGFFKRTVTTSESLFPVGNSTYNPGRLTRSSGSGIYNMRVLDDVYRDGLSGSLVTTQVVDRTWGVTADGAVGTLTLEVQWNQSEELTGFLSGSCYVAHYRSGAWATDTPNSASGSTNKTRIRSNITSLSPFAVASGSALPIELLSFSGERAGTAVQLAWRTASEINNSHFLLERSADGRSFREIANIPGAGYSLELRNYAYTDRSPLHGINYYRLKQVDFDGSFTYSPVVSVRFDGEGGLQVYPIPAKTEVTLLLPEGAEEEGLAYLFDQNGRLVKEFALDPDTPENRLSLLDLPAGAYVLKVQTGRAFVTRRIVKVE